MSPVVSIIVPVYNAEKTLKRCVNSIINQLYKDWELLLVDDGSTDDSSIICDEYAQQDGRIKVFHKQNGGVSSARNVGLDNAIGEWVTFIDSDDWIEKRMLNILNIVSNVDLICCYYVAEGWKEWVSEPYKDKIYKDNMMSEFLTECLLKSVFIWGKFLKKELIEKYKMRFDTNLSLYEDTLFIYSYICYIKSVQTFSDSFYHYDKNESSLSKRCEDWQMYSNTLERELIVVDYLGRIFQWNSEKVRNMTTLFFTNRYIYYVSMQESFFSLKEKLKVMLQSDAVVYAIKHNNNRTWKGKILDWLMIHQYLYIASCLLYLKNRV